MINRTAGPIIQGLAQTHPVLTVTGPRQSGKTTLCRMVFPEKAYVNLENPATRAFALDDPVAFLKQHHDGAIIDEIQRAPDLTSHIQAFLEDDVRPGLFILTGSRQLEVMDAVSQSLAGRTALVKLLPFSLDELAGNYETGSLDALIAKGFCPRIYDRGLDPAQALGDYFETCVERDVRRVIQVKDLRSFEKFVRLCAARVGQLLNLTNLADDTGISHTTARAWMSVLEAMYVVFLLQPYYKNLGKRLIKSPKLYFYDVGLASHLLGIEGERHATGHPLRGNLIENLVVMEVLKHRLHRGAKGPLSFYRDSAGHEVDLLVPIGPEVFPVEIKAGATFSPDYLKGLTAFSKAHHQPSGRGAVVYAGDAAQERHGILIHPAMEIHALLDRLPLPGLQRPPPR
ncbi:MAG: ATP-binding protein [Elusimicrobia bacterium]|nr:ATP-binding protein [Elusimicrobiota bacterium]